jgi:hypothetical protein
VKWTKLPPCLLCLPIVPVVCANGRPYRKKLGGSADTYLSVPKLMEALSRRDGK